ncbi:MAG: hypothetical protein ACE5F1_20470, partial [Planctomycetota bacterium]
MRTTTASSNLLPIFLAPVLLTSLAQAQLSANEKTLYNLQHTSSASRATQAAADTLFYVQSSTFRLGHGGSTGVRVTIQDENQATAEQISYGLVSVTSGVPDNPTTGTIIKATITLFGSGTGVGAFSFSLPFFKNVASPSPAAIMIDLPAPKSWPTDATTVHIQTGTSLKLPVAITPPVLSYKLAAGSVVKFDVSGTTINAGGLYNEPTTGVFISSKAYGVVENLFGLESLFPDSTRGDGFGFYVNGQVFANQFALIMLSPTKLAAPIQTQFGPILIDPQGVVFLPLLLPVDKWGHGQTGTVPVPALKLTLWAQTGMINFAT